MKIIIHRADLTAAEIKTLEQHSDGYDARAEFWTGFVDCQHDGNCRNRWPNSDAGEAWSRGWEAWTRVRLGRTPQPWNEYDRDDGDSLKQIATLRRLNAERKNKIDKAAAWARVFEPGRYPRLHSVGNRAGRVGADRFRGRYVPHLVYDHDRPLGP
jgi:hypothetical protein